MQVQNIDSSNPNVKFGALSRDAKTMSEAVFNRVVKTDMLEAFGERFDATIGIDYFMSTREPGVRRMALFVNDIKPLTVGDKIKGLFSRRPRYMTLQTSATNEDAFIVSVSSHPQNRLIRRMEKGNSKR